MKHYTSKRLHRVLALMLSLVLLLGASPVLAAGGSGWDDAYLMAAQDALHGLWKMRMDLIFRCRYVSV